MRGKILVSVVVAAALVVGGLYVYANQRTRALVDARLQAMVDSGQYDSLSYESLRVGLTGTFTMNNLHVVQGPKNVVVQRIHVRDFDPLHEIPWSLDFQLEGLQFPQGTDAFAAELAPVQRAVLGDLMQGDTLPVALRYRYDYEPSERERINSEVDLNLPDSFAFNLQSTTRGIPLAAFVNSNLDPNDPMAAMTRMSALMNQGEMPTTTVTLTDSGLLDTLMEHSAAQTGSTPEAVRAQLVSRVSNLHLMVPTGLQGVVQTASAEVVSFLNGNSTLQVRMNPEFGGSFAQLQPQIMGAVFSGDFAQVVELLHLEIENLTR